MGYIILVNIKVVYINLIYIISVNINIVYIKLRSMIII